MASKKSASPQPVRRGREKSTSPRTPNEPGARRQEILDAAAQLFATQGVVSTTVRDIGQAAGILSGSLYHYFDSKETMVEEIVNPPVSLLLERDEEIIAASSSAAEAIEQLLRTIIGFVFEHQVVWQILNNDIAYLRQIDRFAYLDEQERRITEIWTSTITRGIAEGSVRADVPPDLTYRYVRDSVTTMPRWYRKDGAHSEQTIIDSWVKLAFDGMHGERRHPAPISGSRPARAAR